MVNTCSTTQTNPGAPAKTTPGASAPTTPRLRTPCIRLTGTSGLGRVVTGWRPRRGPCSRSRSSRGGREGSRGGYGGRTG